MCECDGVVVWFVVTVTQRDDRCSYSEPHPYSPLCLFLPFSPPSYSSPPPPPAALQFLFSPSVTEQLYEEQKEDLIALFSASTSTHMTLEEFVPLARTMITMVYRRYYEGQSTVSAGRVHRVGACVLVCVCVCVCTHTPHRHPLHPHL